MLNNEGVAELRARLTTIHDAATRFFNRPKGARTKAENTAISGTIFFFSSRRRHTRGLSDWSSDVCSSDLLALKTPLAMLLLLPLCFRRKVAQPMLFSLAILLCAFASRIHIGTRHVLPIYVGLAVACGIAAAPLLGRRPAPAAG